MSGALPAQLGPWASARLPASWRGVPFRVRDSEIKRGRRTAVHEYPFKDDVWVEDLGRATRLTSFRGFLAGDDCDAQLQAMLTATEAAGPGTFVHPALGSISGSLVDFTASDQMDAGRVWELQFSFISGVDRSYPTMAPDTSDPFAGPGAEVTMDTQAAFASTGATLENFVSSATAGITNASLTVAGIGRTVGSFVSTAERLTGDVSALGRLAGVQGNYGRFSLGARLSVQAGVSDVAMAAATANAAAANVSRLGNAVNQLAAFTGPFVLDTPTTTGGLY